MLRRLNLIKSPSSSLVMRSKNTSSSFCALFSQYHHQFRFCSASSSTTATAALFEQAPAGWTIIEYKAAAEILIDRLPDEDGVIARPEDEHRRIYSPYSTTTPFRKEAAVVTAAGGEQGQEVGQNKKDIVYISKKFNFGQFPPLYHWMGRVSAMAEQIDCFPELDWFYMDVTATVPLTKQGLTLAWYMSDEETNRANARNTSDKSGFEADRSLARPENNPEFTLPAELTKKVEEQAIGEFCWLVAGESSQRELFTSEIYLQWYHRADYLVSRKAKEATEYRNSLTLEQVLQSASQNRKRRRDRREEIQEMKDKFKPMDDTDLPPQYLKFKSRKDRDAVRKMQMFGMDGRDGTSEIKSTSEANHHDVNEMAPSRHQFVIDTLPREIREKLERDDDGTAHGFGGGVRQTDDPLAFQRAQSNPGYSYQQGGSMHSGGSWH